MIHSAGFTAFLALSLFAKHVVAAPAPRDPSVTWGSCGSFGVNSTDPNFQCGYLDVPMDYHDSSAGNARLAVIKYAATASKKLGTIFFNPGGPGGSGLQALAELGKPFSEIAEGTFDFISWDPRGVGHTFPGEVYCFSNAQENAAFWVDSVTLINETISGKFNDRDYNELFSQVDSTEQKIKAFTAGCQNGASGPYLKYIGTSSTVRDLVSLGDAILGSGQPIDYYGISYGTVIGFNFVNMFPERAGHVILDGVVDPKIWITYKTLQHSLTDSEKTYSGLTDGCAKAGRAGCKLVEITGDGATGDDVKTLINYAIDLDLELTRQGYQVPLVSGTAKELLYGLLYDPTTWSQEVNGDVYSAVTIILRIAEAHNVTIPGSRKYNIPTGNISLAGSDSTPMLVSYTSAAIAGADDFSDSGVTIKDVFDVIVSNTREVTPTFGTLWSLGYTSYGWPVRSVEKLPPYTPAKLKLPVLVVGNSADPITPFAGAQSAANLLGDNAFLVEQLGFGHTSLAQVSTCTLTIFANYVADSKLPQGRSTQCAVDNSNLFPPLNGTTTTAKRSNFLRRWM